MMMTQMDRGMTVIRIMSSSMFRSILMREEMGKKAWKWDLNLIRNMVVGLMIMYEKVLEISHYYFVSM